MDMAISKRQRVRGRRLSAEEREKRDRRDTMPDTPADRERRAREARERLLPNVPKFEQLWNGLANPAHVLMEEGKNEVFFFFDLFKPFGNRYTLTGGLDAYLLHGDAKERIRFNWDRVWAEKNVLYMYATLTAKAIEICKREPRSELKLHLQEIVPAPPKGKKRPQARALVFALEPRKPSRF